MIGLLCDPAKGKDADFDDLDPAQDLAKSKHQYLGQARLVRRRDSSVHVQPARSHDRGNPDGVSPPELPRSLASLSRISAQGGGSR
jgi:hypothetical protein